MNTDTDPVLTGTTHRGAEAPVFLVGAERSGTTLLRLMLDHHPQIAFHFEFEFAVDMLPDDETAGWPDIHRFQEWLGTQRVFRIAGYQIDRELDYPNLVRDFLSQKQQQSGNKPIVGATVHRSFDKLPRIWPDARYIHIIRDGRDVARSVVQMGWAGNVWDASRRWLEAEQTWRRLRSVISSDRWAEVKFETLTTQPREPLQRLCDFIGVPYSPAMLEYHTNSSYQPPDAKAAYRWKRKMTNWQLRLVEAAIGEQLRENGYELTNDQNLRLSTLTRAVLTMHSRCGSALFRCRRYGLKLFLQDLLTRRLHLISQRQRVQDAIDAIEAKHLK